MGLGRSSYTDLHKAQYTYYQKFIPDILPVPVLLFCPVTFGGKIKLKLYNLHGKGVVSKSQMSNWRAGCRKTLST